MVTFSADTRTEQGYRAYGLRVLGDVASNTALLDPAAAAKPCGETLGVAKANDMRPMHEPTCPLKRHPEQPAAAATHLSEAGALATSINQVFWSHLRVASQPQPQRVQPLTFRLRQPNYESPPRNAVCRQLVARLALRLGCRAGTARGAAFVAPRAERLSCENAPFSRLPGLGAPLPAMS